MTTGLTQQPSTTPAVAPISQKEQWSASLSHGSLELLACTFLESVSSRSITNAGSTTIQIRMLGGLEKFIARNMKMMADRCRCRKWKEDRHQRCPGFKVCRRIPQSNSSWQPNKTTNTKDMQQTNEQWTSTIPNKADLIFSFSVYPIIQKYTMIYNKWMYIIQKLTILLFIPAALTISFNLIRNK